ncbi:MAG: diphthamide synthesis protein [Nitrososphaeria archaeon]
MPGEGAEIYVRVDLGAVDEALSRIRPRRAGVAAPDGMHGAAREVYDHLRGRGVEPVMILDPTYGFCDLQDRQSEDLGLDVVFNVGHWSPVRSSGRTVLVDAEYVISPARIGALAEGLIEEARRRGWGSVGVFTTSNYREARDSLVRALEGSGIAALPGAGDETALGPTMAWQVTGCMFRGPWAYAGRVNGAAFLGSSRFHAVALRMSTGVPTLMLDPELLEVSDVEEDARRALRRAALAIYRAAEARSFGIVTGEKSGQRYVSLSRALGRRLEGMGRDVYYFSAYEITAERLGLARYVDAFIVLACPRIGLDSVGLDRPVLSYPQALQLLRVLRGESLNMDELLRMPLWAWSGYDGGR